jgi:hypothetical protein
LCGRRGWIGVSFRLSLSSSLSKENKPTNHPPPTTDQVTVWYINYHRRGWAQDRWDHYKSRLSDAEAAFHAAVAEARRAADIGGDGGAEEAARRAADAEAARLDALVEELGAKERLARKELDEHKSKKRGGC